MRRLNSLALAFILLVLALFGGARGSSAALLVTNEGEAQILSVALGKASPETLTIKLYANDKAPAETDTAASYTEASGGGYASVSLTGSSWTVTPGAPTEAVYPQVSWTFTGALTTNPTIYGYYVVGATSGKVYWAERLAASFTPAANGDVQRVTPKFTLE